MANSTVNDSSSLIKHQIKSQERIFEHLTKAQVLLDHALESDLLYKPASFTQYYFWVIADLTEKAAKISEEALNTLLRNEAEQFQMAS